MAQLTENAIKLLQEKQYFREGEKTWNDLCHRVATAIGSAEENFSMRTQITNELFNAMSNQDFIFSTPVLLNADTTHEGQLSSCFVLDVQDNIESICQLDAQFAKIFQRNGGAGANLSALRPIKSKVETSNGYAGGVLSFMRKYDSTADEMTKNNPSRKGALKINLSIFHPQIYDFISCKDDTTQLQRMNISVSLSDEFMLAVRENKDWNLRFPDYSWNKEIYNNEWNGEIEDWEAKGYPVNIYQTVKARDLFHSICEHAWKTGEPGTNFSTTMKRDNKNQHISTKVETNPCSEFTNIPYSSCNLGSINLSNFINKDETFDTDRFKTMVYKTVRWFDNMITINKLPLKEIEEITKGIRPIGLGFMGLAHAMFKMGIKYNSIAGYNFTQSIVNVMRQIAENASMDLAKERGAYPLWKGSTWSKENKEIRNSSLLSIAPTGSISFIANTSGGCEPEFALVYSRRTYDGTLYYITNEIFENKLKEIGIYSKELMEKIVDNHGSCQGIDEIPKAIQEVFVTAHDIAPEEHLKMLSSIQKLVDLSVSKTINLSYSATVEDVEKIFEEAHKQGVKGLTVYRDGSRDNQTLSVSRKDNLEQKKYTSMPRGFIEEVPDDLIYRKYKLKNGCGKLYFFVGVDDIEERIYDVFTNTDAVGGCSINTQANSRLLSAGMRGGVPIEYLVSQLEKSGSCASYQALRGKQTGMTKVRNMILNEISVNTINKIDELIGTPVSMGKSCPSSIAEVLKNILKEFNGNEFETIEYQIATKQEVEKVKELKHETCTHPNMRMAEGCIICPDCGYSKCG